MTENYHVIVCCEHATMVLPSYETRLQAWDAGYWLLEQEPDITGFKVYPLPVTQYKSSDLFETLGRCLKPEFIR